MKYYQSSFKEYIHSCQTHDIHPYIDSNIDITNHHIIYGPNGSGKYTQALKLIYKNSNSQLKYEKKITCFSEKGEHTYKISDIHFEIDMSILGCNAKQLFNDIFIQIIEIIAVKPEKKAFIICKHFHNTHIELLELFYNYIQQSRNNIYNIKIYFILLCDTISCLPYNIVKSCNQICIKRPPIKDYIKICSNNESGEISKRPLNKSTIKSIHKIIEQNPNIELTNLKELFTLDLSDSNKDIFNIICDSIIRIIVKSNEQIDYLQFREVLYDILIYDINISECLYYIFHFFTCNNYLKQQDTQTLVCDIAEELKMYNNNYRPIYHLERIFYKILVSVHEL